MQNYPVPHRKYLDKDGGEDRTYSGFSYFMDGSRRTYKIGDMVLEGKKIYPVVAQVRAGCTERDRQKKLHTHGLVQRKNLLLLSDKMNEVDFQEIRQRILKTQTAKDIHLDIVKYHFDSAKDSVPINAAIAKANSMMHDMEIAILGQSSFRYAGTRSYVDCGWPTAVHSARYRKARVCGYVL